MKFIRQLSIVLLLAPLFLRAQSNDLMVNPGIKLPKDSVESTGLISTLNNFLALAQNPNGENQLVLPNEKIETFILLDEFNGIGKNEALKDENFFKPYLANVVPLNNNKYLLQLSYIGATNNTPTLRASFEIIATKTNNTFLFSSPLAHNTSSWKVDTIGNTIFHYKTYLDNAKAHEYNRLASLFDKKLNSENKVTEFYCCDNLVEAEKLIGLGYKLDYNGISESSFSILSGNKTLIILGSNNSNFSEFDPHDLWHERLSLVTSRKLVNKPIDEACAYLYGGSWGISWEEIFKLFKSKVASDKNADWSYYKENPLNFGENKSKHLMADYVVNALIVQKIEKEKGFAGVWKFLNCGPYEKGNDNYYQALSKLTGITRKNYNKKVWELINSEGQTAINNN